MSKRCEKCKRTETYFDGCSMVECPKRKMLTANCEEGQSEKFLVGGHAIKVPTNNEGRDDEYTEW